MSPEQITPYGSADGGSKTDQVRRMFDHIAPAYDRLNRYMSLGLDGGWRRRAVAEVAAAAPRHIVDIACGTGDFAISLARAIGGARVTGVDLSEGMVEVGRRKVAAAGLAGRIDLRTGDCLDGGGIVPGSADAVTVAFGVRNFADLAAGYRAMLRMLRPGGRLCVLELARPASPLVRPGYDLDTRAYSYLPESIAAVPRGEQMLDLMRRAGFTGARYTDLTLGVCCIYTAEKPL